MTGDRLARLDLLAARLKADEPMTAREVAAEMGVSLRTLFRDIALLRERGLPVEADRGRGGGLRMDRRWGAGRMVLTHREAVELLVSLAVAERLGAPWALSHLGPIRRKVAASFAPGLKDRVDGLRRRILIGRAASGPVAGGYGTPAGDAAGPVFAGFLEFRCLRIAYADAAGTESLRLVEPQRLLLSPPVWYLVAWDRGREAARTFRMDRIRSATVTGEDFRLRPDRDFAEAVAGAEAAPP